MGWGTQFSGGSDVKGIKRGELWVANRIRQRGERLGSTSAAMAGGREAAGGAGMLIEAASESWQRFVHPPGSLSAAHMGRPGLPRGKHPEARGPNAQHEAMSGFRIQPRSSSSSHPRKISARIHSICHLNAINNVTGAQHIP